MTNELPNECIQLRAEELDVVERNRKFDAAPTIPTDEPPLAE